MDMISGTEKSTYRARSWIPGAWRSSTGVLFCAESNFEVENAKILHPEVKGEKTEIVGEVLGTFGGGLWDMFGTCLGNVWEVFGRPVEICLGHVLEPYVALCRPYIELVTQMNWIIDKLIMKTIFATC